MQEQKYQNENTNMHEVTNEGFARGASQTNAPLSAPQKQPSPYKKNISLTAILVVLFVFAAAGFFIRASYTEQEKKGAEEKHTIIVEHKMEKKKNNEKGKQKKSFKKIFSKSDSAENMQEKQYAKEVILILKDALKNLDSDICASIQDSMEQKKCKDSVYLTKALHDNDFGLCEDIEKNSLKEYCADNINYSLALSGIVIKYCGKIKDAELKSRCRDEVKMRLSSDSRNVSVCGKISGQLLREKCMDNFYARRVQKKKDISLCSKIKDNSLKNRCLDSLMMEKAVKEKNFNACKNFKNNKNAKLFCENSLKIQKEQNIYLEAVSTGNLSQCGKLADEEMKKKCRDMANYILAFLKKKLTAYCEAISDETIKDKCFKVQGAKVDRYYLKKAAKERDTGVCEDIFNEKTREICKISIE